MIIVPNSAASLKRFLSNTCLNDFAQKMVMRMVLTFCVHRGRMTCSQAAGSIASEPIHRGQLTRFLAGSRWQKTDFNAPLRRLILNLSALGRYLFIVDATLVSQAGLKTKNTYSTGNRKRRPQKGRRYNKKKVIPKKCHSFTFGLLITPCGYRIPFQIPHYTKEYCAEHNLQHQTTAQSAAELIRNLPVPKNADVIVLGDTAYDAHIVRQACDDQGYKWIFPANPERVYEGSRGNRPRLRSRLKDWTSLSLKTIRFRASTGKHVKYRRLSQWRVGPKLKTCVYYAHQEKRDVHSVGRVQIVFSTKKQNLTKATPDDVKILMTNATDMSLSEVIELYSLRWQIELFFRELKSTLGFSHYSFKHFEAVNGWVESAVTTVLFLEYTRAKRMNDKRLSKEKRRWWELQRLHGLCAAFRQECEHQELKNISDRLKTPGGIQKLKRLLTNALPQEYRVAS